jgi:ribose-phosphate pyrophosphokinase
VTHPVFTHDADGVLADDALDRIVTLDAIATERIRSPKVREKLVYLDAAPLFADAIRALHESGSITAINER